MSRAPSPHSESVRQALDTQDFEQGLLLVEELRRLITEIALLLLEDGG